MYRLLTFYPLIALSIQKDAQKFPFFLPVPQSEGQLRLRIAEILLKTAHTDSAHLQAQALLDMLDKM